MEVIDLLTEDNSHSPSVLEFLKKRIAAAKKETKEQVLGTCVKGGSTLGTLDDEICITHVSEHSDLSVDEVMRCKQEDPAAPVQLACFSLAASESLSMPSHRKHSTTILDVWDERTCDLHGRS